jgi:hypothetical protein
MDAICYTPFMVAATLNGSSPYSRQGELKGGFKLVPSVSIDSPKVEFPIALFNQRMNFIENHVDRRRVRLIYDAARARVAVPDVTLNRSCAVGRVVIRGHSEHEPFDYQDVCRRIWIHMLYYARSQ